MTVHVPLDRGVKATLGDVLRQVKLFAGFELEWEWMKDCGPGEGKYILRSDVEQYLLRELNK